MRGLIKYILIVIAGIILVSIGNNAFVDRESNFLLFLGIIVIVAGAIGFLIVISDNKSSRQFTNLYQQIIEKDLLEVLRVCDCNASDYGYSGYNPIFSSAAFEERYIEKRKYIFPAWMNDLTDEKGNYFEYIKYIEESLFAIGDHNLRVSCYELKTQENKKVVLYVCEGLIDNDNPKLPLGISRRSRNYAKNITDNENNSPDTAQKREEGTQQRIRELYYKQEYLDTSYGFSISNPIVVVSDNKGVQIAKRTIEDEYLMFLTPGNGFVDNCELKKTHAVDGAEDIWVYEYELSYYTDWRNEEEELKHISLFVYSEVFYITDSIQMKEEMLHVPAGFNMSLVKSQEELIEEARLYPTPEARQMHKEELERIAEEEKNKRKEDNKRQASKIKLLYDNQRYLDDDYGYSLQNPIMVIAGDTFGWTEDLFEDICMDYFYLLELQSGNTCVRDAELNKVIKQTIQGLEVNVLECSISVIDDNEDNEDNEVGKYTLYVYEDVLQVDDYEQEMAMKHVPSGFSLYGVKSQTVLKKEHIKEEREKIEAEKIKVALKEAEKNAELRLFENEEKKKTYYEILEITKNTSQEVIKGAYKALALKYHPDTAKMDKDIAAIKMRFLNQAYETLSDSKKRAEYDRTL